MAEKDHDLFVPMNSRNPEMWAAIKSTVDFKDKSVVDLGCGYGDMLLRAYNAGASQVVGIDKDISVARERCAGRDIELIEGCLYEWLESASDIYDIMICFSVLPYVKSMPRVLHRMWLRSRQALIECQYEGDGPGIVKDDKEMYRHLYRFWPEVYRIGESKVKIRDTTRSIWLCNDTK